MSKDWTYKELSDKYMLVSVQNVNLVRQVALMKKTLEIYADGHNWSGCENTRFEYGPSGLELAEKTLEELEKMKNEQDEQYKKLLEITK